MNQSQENNKFASIAAFISSGLFAAMTVSFIAFPDFPIVTAYIGIAVHLLMLVIVFALPAPEIGRIAGYVWLLMDTALGVLTLYITGSGGDMHFLQTFEMPFRFGLHLCGCLWVISASWRAKGLTRIIGLLFAIPYMAVWPLVAAWAPKEVFFVFTPLMPIWLLLAGFTLRRANPKISELGVLQRL